MRYIGSKAGLLDELTQILSTHCPRAHSVIDIFAGSGVVTQRLKKEGYLVTGNDCLYFSYCILRGTSGISKMPDFSKLVPLGIDDPIDYLNHLTLTQSGIDLKSCFIYPTLSGRQSGSGRTKALSMRTGTTTFWLPFLKPCRMLQTSPGCMPPI